MNDVYRWPWLDLMGRPSECLGESQTIEACIGRGWLFLLEGEEEQQKSGRSAKKSQRMEKR